MSNEDLLTLPAGHYPSLFNPMGALCPSFLDADFGSRCREYGAEFDSFTPLLARRRDVHHIATITTIANRPQPPATPPAIGAAKELLIIGVNAGGPEGLTEDGVSVDVCGGDGGVDDGGVDDDRAAVEDAAGWEVLLLLSMVELAGISVKFIRSRISHIGPARTNLWAMFDTVSLQPFLFHRHIAL